MQPYSRQRVRLVAQDREPGGVGGRDGGVRCVQNDHQFARKPPNPVPLCDGGLHPLFERCIEPLQLGRGPPFRIDVEYGHHRTPRLTLSVAHCRADNAHPGMGAVPALIEHLQLRVFLAACENASKWVFRPFNPPSVGVEPHPGIVMLDTGRVDEGMAEDALDLRVAVHDPAARCFGDHDADRHGLEHRPQLGAALGQGGLRLPLVRDVAVNADPLLDRAVSLENRHGADGEQAIPTAGPADAVFEHEGRSPADGVFPGRDRHLAVVGVDGCRPTEAAILGLRLASQRFPAALLPSHAAIGGVGPDDAIDGADCGLEPLLARLQSCLPPLYLPRRGKQHRPDRIGLGQACAEGGHRFAAAEAGGGVGQRGQGLGNTAGELGGHQGGEQAGQGPGGQQLDR